MTLDDYSQSDTVCCNSAYIKVPVNAINIIFAVALGQLGFSPGNTVIMLNDQSLGSSIYRDMGFDTSPTRWWDFGWENSKEITLAKLREKFLTDEEL
jgi:hypothetical protein